MGLLYPIRVVNSCGREMISSRWSTLNDSIFHFRGGGGGGEKTSGYKVNVNYGMVLIWSETSGEHLVISDRIFVPAASA